MTLSTKQQSLAQIGAFTAQGAMGKLKTAVNQALDNGMAVNEIKDAMVQLYAYTGFPRSLNALAALSEAVKERQARGAKVQQGRIAAKTPADYDALSEGTKTQTALTGHTVDVSALSPDIDRYLKTHLFGDIFTSDLLSWQEREIVTIAALAQLNGVASQLNAHLAIGRHNGLTDAQLAAVTNIAAPELSQFPTGSPNEAYAQYFDGQSYLHRLSVEQVGIANVTFEPGTRNHWHVHRATQGGGQILVVTAGRGYYQEWGQPAQELRAGDVVHIPANVKHWHGAAPTEWFQHLSIEVPGEHTSNEWLEPVSSEDYNKLQ